MYLKPVRRRAAHQKAYIAVFVCFIVKAVGIGLVEDLSTLAFLVVFRRFIARRGVPTRIFSDNGLNFKDASNSFRELNDMFDCEKSLNDIQIAFAGERIELEFIPPRAPN